MQSHYYPSSRDLKISYRKSRTFSVFDISDRINAIRSEFLREFMASKKQITVGNVKIGSGADISVQTMTNTNTEDIEATLTQIRRVSEIGCDLIRVSCPTPESNFEV